MAWTLRIRVSIILYIIRIVIYGHYLKYYNTYCWYTHFNANSSIRSSTTVNPRFCTNRFCESPGSAPFVFGNVKKYFIESQSATCTKVFGGVALIGSKLYYNLIVILDHKHLDFYTIGDKKDQDFIYYFAFQ